MLSSQFFRNFLRAGKNLPLPAVDFLPVGKGVARFGGEGEKTSASQATPDTMVGWPLSAMEEADIPEPRFGSVCMMAGGPSPQSP